jgi:hypothetical protein
MASRHLRAVVDAGLFDAAIASGERAIEAIRARSGLDLSDPDSFERSIASVERVPWNTVPVAYFTGMMHLTGTKNPALAARYLELAVIAADARDARTNATDGDSSNIRLHARQHLVLAISRADPAGFFGAVAELAKIDSPESVSHWMTMAFRELAAAPDVGALESIFAGKDPTAIPMLPQVAAGQLVRLATEAYGTALANHDFRRASALALTAARLSPMSGAVSGRRRAVLVLMRRPRLLQVVRSAFALIPLKFRSRINPLARL